MHWWQNAYTDRFQEYAPNYLSGEREAELIPLDSIDKVPIAMLSGTVDWTCPHARAEETASIVPAVVNFESIVGKDHNYFLSANDRKFMNLLKSQLQVPGEEQESK